MKEVKVAIVISSCDAFEDCWSPLLKSIKECWPSNEWPVYLITNHKEFNDSSATTIKIGDDKGWASNLQVALKERLRDTDYLVYLQDDFFLIKTVDQRVMQHHVNEMERLNIDCLRLSWPFSYSQKRIGEYVLQDATKKYAMCLQATLWKTSALHTVAIDGWSGWDYERLVHDMVREKQINLTAAVILESDFKNNGIEYIAGTGVRKGRWTNSGYRFLSDNGFNDLLNRRRKEPNFIGFCESHDNFITRLLFLIYFRFYKYFEWL